MPCWEPVPLGRGARGAGISAHVAEGPRTVLRIARLDIRDNPVNHLLTHCLAALVNGDELVPTAVDEGELPQVLLGDHNKVIKTASHGED